MVAPPSIPPTRAPASALLTSLGTRGEINDPLTTQPCPLIAVVVIDDIDHAVPIARGLPVIELTLRTPVTLDAIERIAG